MSCFGESDVAGIRDAMANIAVMGILELTDVCNCTYGLSGPNGGGGPKEYGMGTMLAGFWEIGNAHCGCYDDAEDGVYSPSIPAYRIRTPIGEIDI